MNKTLILLSLCLLAIGIRAQEEPQKEEKGKEKEAVFNTFKSTRVINSHSTETIRANHLDVRITHRFGDFMRSWDPQNSWDNLFGLEDAADVLVGFEYGVTDNLLLGISRTKGGGDLRQMMHGLAKYRILSQTEDGKIPLSIAVVGTATWVTMRRTEFDRFNPSINSFAVDDSGKGIFARRWRYATELHIARKFGEVFSLQVSPIFLWRNLVRQGEQNALFSVNLATRLQITKTIGVLLDANLPVSGMYYGNNAPYRFPLGIGFEFETAGHIFQINFTNSRGIVSTDYLGETVSDWTNGEFRLGFTISRLIQIK